MYSNIYEQLKQLKIKGDIRKFILTYDKINENESNGSVQFLAFKVFYETENWERCKTILSSIKNTGSSIDKIKADLELDFYNYITEEQNRESAYEIMQKCEEIIRENEENSLLIYAHRINVKTRFALLTLGLTSVDEKIRTIEYALNIFDEFAGKEESEALDLLRFIIQQTSRMPYPDYNFTLHLLDKYNTYLKNHLESELLLIPFYLIRVEVELKVKYPIISSILSFNKLPDPLLKLTKQIEKIGHLSGIDQVFVIYGAHLLDLEIQEGISWVKKGVAKLWEIGNNLIANEYKNKAISWLKDRNLIRLSQQLESDLDYIKASKSLSIHRDIKILNEIHGFFIKGKYHSNVELVKEKINFLSSEPMKVSAVCLMVNNAAKINSDKVELIKIIEEWIEKYKGLEKSILLAQLYNFRTIVDDNCPLLIYDLAIKSYKELGIIEDVFTLLISRFHHNIKLRRQKGITPIINDEVIEDIARAKKYLNNTDWVKYRITLLGKLHKALGVALFMDNKPLEASEQFKTSLDYFTNANNINEFAISTHYYSSALIVLGRESDKLSFYEKAKDALEFSLKTFYRDDSSQFDNSFIDFVWRLEFLMALTFYEPLKKKLVSVKERIEEHFQNANKYYLQALSSFEVILKNTQFIQPFERIDATGELNKGINQLIFSGFHFYLGSKQYKASIEWIERARAKSLLIAVASKVSPNSALIRNPLVIKEYELNKKISDSDSIEKKHQLNKSLNQLYQEMVKHPGLVGYVQKRQGKIFDFTYYQNLLKKEEKKIGQRRLFFLYYYIENDNIYAFGVNSNNSKPLFEKISISAINLEKDIRQQYYNKIEKFPAPQLLESNKSNYNESFWTKYNQLIEPLTKWTNPDDIICIIPYSFLHDLPFHALKIDGEPLIKRNPVFFNSSLATWGYLAIREKPIEDFELPFVYGDPNKNLNESLKEVQFIGKLLNVRPFVQEEVTKKAFLDGLSNATSIHFAGHGFFFKEKKSKSGLQLGEKEEITVEEIMNHEIKANFIVLSACNTGIHKYYPGEERAGLITAFLSSGANSVMGSLWEVYDKDASDFFSTFYSKLNSGIPKILAYQQSMVELMERERRDHFYYWGAFVLYGLPT